MQLTDELTRAFHSTGRFLRAQPGAADTPETRTLAQLHACDRSTRLRDLAAAEGVDTSTLSRRIAALVERGLVRAVPDPQDGRARLLSLTPEGAAHLERLRRERAERIHSTLVAWSETDKAQFARLLGRFADTLDAHRAGEAS